LIVADGLVTGNEALHQKVLAVLKKCIGRCFRQLIFNGAYFNEVWGSF
jgi:hypothetical protein